MCERTVIVRGLTESVRETDLQIYFQSKKKSNGGDIDSIVYNPDEGEARITFTDDKVAKKVTQKQHRLKGCSLQVKETSNILEVDMSGDKSLCVLVRGISSKTTKDALVNYFENKRRSSGGDVIDVQIDGDEAVVTFESPETAVRVLEWGKHELDNQSLTVTRKKPNVAKKSTPNFLRETSTEEKSRVVRVTGISAKTTKDALLNFFENKRRSGGGEIEDIQYNYDEQLADITFISPEDAERVSEKQGLKLDEVDLGLVLKEIPKVLPKDPFKVHVMELSDKTTKDGLQSFMEVASGEEVESVLFGENSNVIITFKEQTDFEIIQAKCQKRALDGSHLKVEQVCICDCIEVSGLASKTTNDTILYYFENAKKSGGGDVKRVEYVDGEERALVFFENPSDVEKVVHRRHEINSETLKVVPHYPVLGETSQEPGGGKKKANLTVDPHSIDFIEKFFMQEFRGFLTKHEASYIFEQGQEVLVLSSTNNKVDKVKWNDSCKIIQNYIEQITTREVKVSQAAWKEVIQKAKEKLYSAKDMVETTCKEKEQRIYLQGKKQDVDSLALQLEDMSTEIDKRIEYEKTKVTKTIDVNKSQMDLIIFTGFLENLGGQYKDLETKLENRTIHFRGPDEVVREGNLHIWKYLAKVKDQEMEIPKPIVRMLSSHAGNSYISQEFKRHNIEAVIGAVDGSDDTKLVVTAVDRGDVNKAMHLVKTVMSEDTVPLDEDQQSLLMSEGWKELETDFKANPLLRVTSDIRAYSVSIVGEKQLVDQAKAIISKFFEEMTIVEEIVETGCGQSKHLNRFQKDSIKKIEDKLNHQSVNIRLDEDNGNIIIRGTKEGTEKASTKVQNLVDQIKEKTFNLDKPSSRKLFSDKKGMKLLSNIENDYSCIIERCTRNDEILKTVASSPVTSRAKQICSYVTPEGKTIALFKGDITEQSVDVIVNAANNQLKHIGALALAIVQKGGREIQEECDAYTLRKGDLLDGEVVSTSPGKLPCKRLVHAVGPRWPSYRSPAKFRDEETKEERVLAQTVFNALDEASKFTSIAIPAISAGVFGFPVDLCAKTTIESILAYSEENERGKLSQIYIVDKSDNVIKAFTKEMKSRFGRESSFTDGLKAVNLNTNPTSANKGVRRRSGARAKESSYDASSTSLENIISEEHIKIEIVIGDLAKEEANVIVNTVSSDLDLSKNPCARALSNAAGPRLQQECSKKGNLKAGEIAVTEGYSLGCKNIFHVVAGAPWQNGQGEKVLRSLITSCLREADKRRFSSIAFPAIGTGNLGYPRDVVARVFFEEVKFFKRDNPQTSVLEVHFVLFHKDQLTIDAFQNVEKSSGESEAARYAPSSTKPKKGKRRSLLTTDEGKGSTSSDLVHNDETDARIGSVRVQLDTGDITKESTDAIVTASNTSLKVALGGGVGAAIARAGGPTIQRECNKLGTQLPGSVVCTSAGNLPSQKLFHLIAASLNPKDISDVVFKCLAMAESQKINSIAIPAVGTGNANISPKEAAKSLLKAIGKFCKNHPTSVKLIRIVVFQERMIADFNNALDELDKSETSSGWSLWSWLKGLLSGSVDKKFLPISHSLENERTFYEESTSPSMWLKIFASSDSSLKKADFDIKQLIKEHHKKKVIDNRASIVEKLSPAKKERILRLQQKHATEIEIEKRSARIIIYGLLEDVSETTFEINEILIEETEEEHHRKFAELVAKNVQWYYIEGTDKNTYDSKINGMLEDAYMAKKDSVILTMLDENEKEQHYKIDFKNMKEINLSNRDKNEVVREELGKGIPLPLHWEMQPNEADGKEMDVHLVPLDPINNKQEYDRVANKITGTTINIKKIERVQNPELYRAYMIKKQKMDDRDGSNEMKLFHGTAVDTCKLINLKGFNRSYCGKNAVMFGKGVYFARDASYSMRPTYSPPDIAGNRCMYLASVLVGKYSLGNQHMIAPPPRDLNNLTITYDTTVDNVNNPTVFVAFHDNQVYPEYLITFN